MNTNSITVLASAPQAVTLALGASASAKDPASIASANGTWNLDFAKSDPSNPWKHMRPLKSGTMTLSGNATTRQWTTEWVTTDGKSLAASYSGGVDDHFYPVRYSPAEGAPEGMTFAYMKDGSFAFKDPSGNALSTSTWSLSPDGRTMTVRSVERAEKGEETHTSVWHRVPKARHTQ